MAETFSVIHFLRSLTFFFPEKNEFMIAFQKIKLSQMTIKRRTVELYLDIKKQLRVKLKTSIMGLFSIQLDESTDCSNQSQMVIFEGCLEERK